jgi:hypothetical protein
MSVPGSIGWPCLNSSLGIRRRWTLPASPSICLQTSWLPRHSTPDRVSTSSFRTGVAPTDISWSFDNLMYLYKIKCGRECELFSWLIQTGVLWQTLITRMREKLRWNDNWQGKAETEGGKNLHHYYSVSHCFIWAAQRLEPGSCDEKPFTNI